MPSPFSSLLRSVEADGHRRSLAIFWTGAALLALWLIWFFGARVPVYASTHEARLVVAEEAHPVEAAVTGQVTAIRMVLGQAVQAGDVLVELESDEQRIQLEEARAELAGLAAQRGPLDQQLRAEEEAAAQEREAARVALEEARARHRAAEEAVRLAEAEQGRTRALLSGGFAAEAELHRAEAETRQRRMNAEALKLGADHQALDARTRDSARRAQHDELQRQVAALHGQIATAEARRVRLEYELGRRKLRAPVAGRVAEVAPLRAGALVREGERLGSVVPPGQLKVVADFPPSEALGRIREGQPAQVRLDGFPWTQFGTVPARVSSVASEVRDGRIRVECEIAPDPTSAIPFQHGLTGAVEIQVDLASPATLVLRAAGNRITLAEDRAR